MIFTQRSNYMIFFDDVQVDQYVINWSSQNGLFANNAAANITMFRSEAMDNWKAYLTQVKIFGENPFSGKFTLLFDGEIMNRSWSDSRSDMGKVTFAVKGYYHWLDVQIPLAIQSTDEQSPLLRFIYEAQNINIDEVRELIVSNAEVLLKDNNIEQIIKQLFQKLTIGYYDVAEKNTTFAFAKVEERFKVMVDVLDEFRQAGFLDLFTFTRTTQIESFYVYLNDVLSQLMFEFYQDRDGSFRIKTPSWSDMVMKAHVLDSSIVSNITGLDDWEQEPTRILAIGAETQYLAAVNRTQGAIDQNLNSLQIPVGLYIGDPQDPDSEEYYSSQLQVYLENFGVNPLDYGEGGGFSGTDWYDNVSAMTVNSGHRLAKGGRAKHNGVDLAQSYQQIYSQGTTGVVTKNGFHKTMGNYVAIKQTIAGQPYIFRYMHFNSPAVVAVGSTVSPGQVIGTSGNTGKSSGPHLHFEVWKGDKTDNGTDLEPLAFMKSAKSVFDAAKSITNGHSGPGGPQSVGGNTPASSGGGKYSGKFADVINAAGAKHGVDPLLIACIIQQESNFNPNVVSSAGAKGLMQLMPATAASVGVTKPFDPANNVNGGTKYFKQQLDTFKTVDLALAAYNAGPGNVRKYKNTIPPFKETQNYVKKITANYAGQGGKVGSVSLPTSYSSPYANVDGMKNGGLPFQRVDISGFTNGNKTTGKTSKDVAKETAKAVPYSASDKAKVPSSSSQFQSVVDKNTGGISPALIVAVIATSSDWRPKNEANGKKGLMGIPDAYSNAVLPGQNLLDGNNSINFGSDFLAAAMDRFNGKVTYALAAYHLGSLVDVQKITEEAGMLDFSKSRDKFDKATLAFVDSVIMKYVGSRGNYIKGDPHIDMGSTKKPGGGPVDENGNTLDIENAPAEGLSVPDYEESYKPRLSNEERKYKMNLKRVEQALIRADSPAIQNGENSAMSADRLIYQYAKYTMQLHRARTHNVNISLSSCLPFIRPGFNAWIEPTRTDLVCYVTGVSHQGSFQNGCVTNINAGFVRDPATYREIDTSIFVGETRATSETFGEVILDSDMQGMRDQLKAMHDADSVSDAKNFDVLKGLYTSMNENNEYATTWNAEYTSDEIKSKMATLFADAPEVVVERKNETKTAIDKSRDIFIEKLLYTVR